MDPPAETDVKAKMGRKSDDNSKFERSFGNFGVFLPTSMLDTPTDMSGWSRKIRLGTKSMRAKFDVEGQKKMMKNYFFKNFLN